MGQGIDDLATMINILSRCDPARRRDRLRFKVGHAGSYTDVGFDVSSAAPNSKLERQLCKGVTNYGWWFGFCSVSAGAGELQARWLSWAVMLDAEVMI